MVYGDFKDLPWGTANDSTLRDKAFDITKKSKIWLIEKRSSFNRLYIFW